MILPLLIWGEHMNYLLARIRDRKNGIRCVLSDKEIYEMPNTLDSAVPYAPDDSLEDGEWFYLDNFDQRNYCPDILKSPINGTAYAAITDDDLGIISFLCSIQDDGLVYFQRVTKTQLLRQKRIVFGDAVKFEDSSREIVITIVYSFRNYPPFQRFFMALMKFFAKQLKRRLTVFWLLTLLSWVNHIIVHT